MSVEKHLSKQIDKDDAGLPFHAAKHVALGKASNVKLRNEDA